MPPHIRTALQGRICFALLAAGMLVMVCGAFWIHHIRIAYEPRNCREESQCNYFTVESALDRKSSPSYLVDINGKLDVPPEATEPIRLSGDPGDSSLETALPDSFRSVLRDYTIYPLTDVKIVLIVAYYRSGSTFFGELMSSRPRTFFHYEPLMLFTVSGGIRPGRQRHAFQLLDALVRCRFDPLYTVWLENNPYYKYNHFLADICEGGESCSSPCHLSALCSRAGTQVFKFTRLRVSQVESWIKQNSDIAQSIRVVHLVRDPRAIYSSRRGLRWCTDYESCGSAAALCDQMRSDLDAFEELARRLQAHRTYRIRFEDLTSDPVNETRHLFEWLGLDYGPSVLKYIEHHTTATAADIRNAHSTRRNTRLVANSWKWKLSTQTIRMIEDTCEDVLQRLGYEIPAIRVKGENT